MQFPDYNNSIVNLASSIIRHFGANCGHDTLPCLDGYLAKGYKNVVLLLFDGIGVDSLEYHLPENSFLRKHFIKEISSVFPSTTTAATVSITSGLTPAEHGWLGWSLYFKEINHVVNIFPNTIKDSDNVQAADYHVASKYMPFKDSKDLINEVGVGLAYAVLPFGDSPFTTHYDLYERVKTLCGIVGKKYIYAYWYQPDEIMHKTGCYSESAKTTIEDINIQVEKLCSELEDTLVIVTADHGHINVTYKFVCDYPVIVESLSLPISIECRATTFFVKEDFLDKFPEEFQKAFGDDFLLLTKKEVIEMKLFGDGVPHPKFSDFIGDFLAVSIADVAIAYSRNSRQFVSNHAGLTKKEMSVPLIVIET